MKKETETVLVDIPTLEQLLTSISVLRYSYLMPESPFKQQLVSHAQTIIDRDFAINDTLQRLELTPEILLSLTDEEWLCFVQGFNY